MKELSVEDIIRRIKRSERINCLVKGGFFHVKVSSYTPVIGLALGGGNRLEIDYADLIKYNPTERELLEEAFTDVYLNRMPIQLTVKDSKLLYDLAGERSSLINEKNYIRELTKEEKVKFGKVYTSFYKILKELVMNLSKKGSKVSIYDFHSADIKKMVEVRVGDKASLVEATDLVEKMKLADKSLAERSTEIREVETDFGKFLKSKFDIRYMGVYVNGLFMQKSRNDYYIVYINRVRRALAMGINDLHPEIVIKREIMQ